MGCAIRCHPDLSKKIGEDLNGGKAFPGLGCVACCLMAHENVHCLQGMLGFLPPGMGTEQRLQAECVGWREEQRCLERVLGGHKCSG